MKNLLLVFFVLAVIAIHNVSTPSLTPLRLPAGTRGEKGSGDAFPQWKTKEGSYKFVYTYKGNVLTIEKPGPSEEAFTKAAKECFDHFNPIFTTEDEGMDVIDVCANPRVN